MIMNGYDDIKEGRKNCLNLIYKTPSHIVKHDLNTLLSCKELVDGSV